LQALLTRMQTEINKVEDEVTRIKIDTRSEMANAVQQLTMDLAKVNHICDEYEKKVEECRTETIFMIAEKLPDM